MDCSHAQSLLDTYLDQELDPVRNLEIEEHLHGCAACAQNYGDRQMIRQSLKTESLYFKAPQQLEKRIQRSLRQAAKAEAPARWFSGSWFKMAAPLGGRRAGRLDDRALFCRTVVGRAFDPGSRRQSHSVIDGRIT